MKKLLTIFLLSLCTIMLVPNFSLAQAKKTTKAPAAAPAKAPGIDQALSGLNTSAETAMPGITKTKGKTVNTIISKGISTVLSFVGIIFMILIISGGLMWMTSGGDSGKVEKSKKLMVNATIGLAFVLSAYALTVFVIDSIIKSVSN